MSDLGYYVALLEDRRRLAAFRRAIERVVKPGDHVVEVGCGVGTYSLMAAQAGARRVSAIDRSPVAMALAREIGVERLSGGRVRLIEESAETVILDEPADVVIFEDFGSFVYRTGLRRLFDQIRGRLAKPEARWIPGEIEILVAPIDLRLRTLDPGDLGPLPFPADAVALIRKRALNDPTWKPYGIQSVAGPAAVLARVRLVDGLPSRSAFDAVTQASRDTKVTGLGAWMRLHLAPGEVLDNSPAEARPSWYLEVLPFEDPLPVRAGEELRLSIEVAHGPGPAALMARWSVRGAGGIRESTSANSVSGDLSSLLRGSPDQIPRLSERAPLLRELLTVVDGKCTVAEAAERLYSLSEGGLPDVRAAENLILDVLERLRGVYTR